MIEQEEIVRAAKKHGYNRFHPDWFKNNQINPKSWYLELCLLQKWIRETHDISIIIPYACGYTILFNLLRKEGRCEYPNQKFYDTYEEALEEGLYEALKLIK